MISFSTKSKRRKKAKHFIALPQNKVIIKVYKAASIKK